jgi:hypothetical protein
VTVSWSMQKEMIEIYSEKLLQRRYRVNTQKTYLSLFKKYLLFFKLRPIVEITKAEIEDYICFLIQSKKSVSAHKIKL